MEQIMKYRKKPDPPIIFEAFQVTQEKERCQNNFDWPEWAINALSTLDCPYRIDWNDWVIKGEKGEIYSCRPNIFEQTYEPVN